MTHRRKRFIAYPPDYDPEQHIRPKKCFSKFQALKIAQKMGNKSEIVERICIVEPRSIMDIGGREWVFNRRWNINE